MSNNTSEDGNFFPSHSTVSKVTYHRDGDVTLRLTGLQLRDVVNSMYYGAIHWHERAENGDALDRDIARTIDALHKALGAIEDKRTEKFHKSL